MSLRVGLDGDDVLEGGRIFTALGLAAVAAVGLAMATAFAVLAVDRGGAGYFIGLVLSLAMGVGFTVATFIVASGRKR
jgi:hypothetical protein